MGAQEILDSIQGGAGMPIGRGQTYSSTSQGGKDPESEAVLGYPLLSLLVPEPTRQEVGINTRSLGPHPQSIPPSNTTVYNTSFSPNFVPRWCVCLLQ
jgi:hypothetical protein